MPANINALNQSLTNLERLLRENSRGAVFEKDEQCASTLHVRYWGHWEVPADEEDDGDYDWEELSESSWDLLKKLIERVEAANPGIKVEASTSEKNWIAFTVREI
jgi:hypothetical protein